MAANSPSSPRPRSRRIGGRRGGGLLAELLGSRARAEVLRVFFGLGAHERTVAEVIDECGMRGQGVDEQLRRLCALELLCTRTHRRHRYYSANEAHPLFPELRGLALKSTGLSEVLGAALQSDQIEVAFIFGSVARREERAESDIDLMIIGDLGMRDCTRLLRGVTDQLGRLVNAVTYSRADVAQRLASGNHFLTRVLEQPKVFLVGSELRLAALLAEVRGPKKDKQAGVRP